MGDVRHQGLQLPPLFIHLAPVFLEDTVQSGEAVADTGEDGLTVFGSGRLLAAGNHAVHGLAQAAGKLGQPLGEKLRQQEQPGQRAGCQHHTGRQHSPLAGDGGEKESEYQHGDRRAGFHQQEHGFDGHTPHFRSPPVH